MQCSKLPQCDDAVLFYFIFFLPPNSSLWIISHWISCRIGIFCSSCCTGWTLGDCAWQSSLWRYYRASAWLQSSSIFVSPSLVLFAAWHVCSGAIQILTRPLIRITFVCVWPLLFLKVIDPKIFIMHVIIIIFFWSNAYLWTNKWYVDML